MNEQVLFDISQMQHRTLYVKLLAVDLEGRPLEEIEGRATGGTITISGTSAVQRQCNSISLVSGSGLKISQPLWALKSRFKVQLGIEYQNDIHWIKLGTFLITKFSISHNVNSCNISISGIDKMALLNGDVAGTLNAEHNFGDYDQIDNEGLITTHKREIYHIIREAVHTYGNEPFANIIINDFDTFGYEQWRYVGEENKALYLFYDNNNDKVVNFTLDENHVVDGKALKDWSVDEFYHRNSSLYELDQNRSKVARVLPGENAGYHLTPLTYPGELILKAGETIKGLLDKICQVLGSFEYFYDVDGRFVFQKKKTYIQNLFQPLDVQGNMIPLAVASKYSYKFEDTSQIVSCSNNPNIEKIKNDFSIWGTAKGVNGVEKPVHARFAIKHRPGSAKPGEDPKPYKTMDRYEQVRVYYVGLTRKSKSEDGRLLKVSDKQNDAGENIEINNWLPDNDYYYLDEKNINYQNDNILRDKATKYIAQGTDPDDEEKQEQRETYSKIKNTIAHITVTSTSDWLNMTKARDALKAAYASKVDTSEAQEEFKGRFGAYLPSSYSGGIPEEFTLVSVYIYAEVSNSDLKIAPIESSPTQEGDAVAQTTEDDDALKIYDPSTNSYGDDPGSGTDLKVARWRLRKGRAQTNVDWREVLYQMALDYYDHHEEESFAKDLREKNPDMVSATGLTGFEPFYADMQAFWRQLYNPEGLWEEGYIPSGPYKHWHESVLLNPETLNFWIDFLDTYGELEQYSMDVIGHRPYKDSNNGNKVTCVASKDIPEVLYWTIGDEAAPEQGELQALTPLQITPDMRNLFVIASGSQSAMSRINTLISNTTLMADAISLTTVPIYQILPNTRIYVRDDEAHVEGDYQVTNVTIPLNHTGNMSIAAAKIVKQIN